MGRHAVTGSSDRQKNVADADVQHWLSKPLALNTLRCWRVLTAAPPSVTLLPPEYLARLLGYEMEPVVAALDSLSALQLLKWSAQSRGARSYRVIAPAVLSRTDALEQLLALGEHRAGRLLLGKHLGRGDRTPHEELQTVRQFLNDSDATLFKIKLLFGRTSGTVQ